MTPPTLRAMRSATPHDPEQHALTARLVISAEELTDTLGARVLASERSYAESSLLAADDLRLLVFDNLEALLSQLAGTGPERLDVPRATGRMKAEFGLPVSAMLHAYRLGGRLIWERLLDVADERSRAVLPQMATKVWTLVDDYSGLASAAYGQFTVELAQRDELARSRLLDCLLSGSADESAMWESLRILQLPDQGRFLVVMIEVGASRTEVPRRVEDRLRARGVHSVWTVEPGAALGLLSLPSALREQTVLDSLEDLATARIGVSRSFSSVLGAPVALREAQVARRCTTPGLRSVNSYGLRPIPQLVAHLPEATREFAEQVLGPVLELPEAERDGLLSTLATWYSCGGSCTEVARRLHYHRNTIRLRLQRIEELTGRSSADPVSSAELYVALQAVDLNPGALGCRTSAAPLISLHRA